MRPLTASIKQHIAERIKNRLDISDLLNDVDLRNADLSYAIIKNLVRIDTDMSNCNFSYAVIGSDESIISILRTKMRNCNFEGAKFIGKTWMRNCDARGCNFRRADVHLVEYQHSDFRESSFCDAIIAISTKSGIGCKFPKQMFYDLCKGWSMKINVEEE